MHFCLRLETHARKISEYENDDDGDDDGSENEDDEDEDDDDDAAIGDNDLIIEDIGSELDEEDYDYSSDEA